MLTDGTRITCDVLVACTGYRIRHPYLRDPPVPATPLRPEQRDSYYQDYLMLYKQVLDARRTSLAFVGVVR